MKYLQITFLLLIGGFTTAYSQVPPIEWAKCYGGSNGDVGYAIQQTTDGGYIMAGYSYSNDGDITVNYGGADFLLVKLSATGVMVWEKSYGGSGNDWATDVKQTNDGGYIIAGYTNSNDGDVVGWHPGTQTFGITTDAWIVKVSNTGILEWQKCLGGSLMDEAASIQLTTDGGYIIAGSTDSVDGDVTGWHAGGPFAYDDDFWVVKLSNAGNIEWQKCYGGFFTESAKDVKQTSDGGYIIVGTEGSYDNGDITGSHNPVSGAQNNDYWVVKIDAMGTLQWQKCLGGTEEDIGSSILETSDGGYIVAGDSRSTDGDVTGNYGNADIWVVKLNNSGNIVWQKSYGGTLSEYGNSIAQTSDGGYILASQSGSNDGLVNGNHGNNDFWILKLTATGTVQWQKSLGGTDNDQAFMARETNDGGFIVAGRSISNDGDVTGNHSNTDAWVVKLNTTCIPSLNINASATNICSGTPVTFNTTIVNGGTNPVYQWLLNGVAVSNNNSYTNSSLNNNDSIICILTSNAACVIGSGSTAMDTVVITVNTPSQPLVTITADKNQGCFGTTVTFTALAQYGGSSPIIQWVKNGINVGSNASFYADNSLNNGDVISCTLISNSNCIITTNAQSNIIVMNVKTPVTPTVTVVSSATDICQGIPVTFTATATNAGTLPVFQWRKNGINVGTNSNTFSDNSLHNNDIVDCIITSSETCVTAPASTSNIIKMIVYDYGIKLNLGPDTVVCKGTPVLLKAQIGFKTYEWQNGSIDPNFNVTNAGLYYVQVIDNNNCITRDSIIVSEKECFKGFYIPNAFTPNNDMYNNTFKPLVYDQLIKYEFRVFNRWGEIIFTTTDINTAWDGKWKGKPQESDVYAWICIYQLINEPLKTAKGTVTLLR